MSIIQSLTNIESTTLWQHLERGYTGDDARVAKSLASQLVSICQLAYDRMRAFPSLHPQYTLHDEIHLLRVTELMARIIPDAVLHVLNPLEVALLILAAHYHDQGMVLDASELATLHDSQEFLIFADNWGVEHPNLGELRRRRIDTTISGTERIRCERLEFELDAAMLTDFVRVTHGQRSANYVRNFHTDARWSVVGSSLTELVAKLCVSHVRPAVDLNPSQGYFYDESIGSYKINMPYLGMVLRLADILDFDRERTPDVLYRTIHFTSDISIQEWAKHRSVEGWSINSTEIRFTVRCLHPIYERAVRQLMDWVDEELVACYALANTFPASVNQYELQLPLKVDRSRIGPANDSYVYHDLEFTLARDEVVKLFMTDRLYRSKSLFIRELLQNSLDALRHRRALFQYDAGVTWSEGNITFEHFQDEHGDHVLRCTDNGIGMDEHIITKFLTKAGRSYYRSPEFESERVRFRTKNLDFDPCAQFGIGFLSIFMLGDRATVYTRRDYGPMRGYGTPLVIEINGLGSIVVIRKGQSNQPVGTSIEIVARTTPRVLDTWTDQVRLVSTLEGVALACEFPIKGHCSIPTIEGVIHIPPTTAIRKTELEETELQYILTIDQPFSEVDGDLGGAIRSSFITDCNGVPVLASPEAKWEFVEKPRKIVLRNDSSIILSSIYNRDSRICIDGIFVCGDPGRTEENPLHFSTNSVVHLGPDEFTMDVRGRLKPVITASREAPDSGLIPLPSWQRLQYLADIARGLLWTKVVTLLSAAESWQTVWELSSLYNMWLTAVPARLIWQSVRFPVVVDDELTSWKYLAELGLLKVITDQSKYEITLSTGEVITDGGKLKNWRDDDAVDIRRHIQSVVISLCSLQRDSSGFRLRPQEPDDSSRATFEYVYNVPFVSSVYALHYGVGMSGLISAQFPIRTVNRDHPLIKTAFSSRFIESKSEFQEFSDSLMWYISDPENQVDFGNVNLRVSRQMHYIGKLAAAIDWNSVLPELRPPYRVMMSDGTITTVGPSEFKRWEDDKTYLNDQRRR